MKLPNSISEMVEERISELDYKLGLSNLRKKERKRIKKKIKQTWYSEKLEGKKRMNGAERIIEEIIVKIFPNLILKY